MSLVPVKSSNIAEIGYSGTELHVKFRGGDKVYVYEGVPEKLHQELMDAESVGQFFSKHIKAGGFKHRVI